MKKQDVKVVHIKISNARNVWMQRTVKNVNQDITLVRMVHVSHVQINVKAVRRMGPS